MAAIDDALDGILFQLIDQGNPYYLNDLGAVLYEIESRWGTQPRGSQVNSESALVQGASKIIAQSLRQGGANDWINLQKFKDKFFQLAPEAIEHFIGDNFESYYLDRIGVIRRNFTPGSGVGVTFNITDGIDSVAASYDIDFSAASPVAASWTEKYFISTSDPTKRQIFWFKVDGGGDVGPVMADVALNYPAPGGVTDSFHAVSLTTGDNAAAVTLAIKGAATPLVPAVYSSVNDNAGTFDFTNAYKGVVTSLIAASSATLGFAVPVTTLVAGVDQAEESTTSFWETGDTLAKMRTTESLFGGSWFVVYYSDTAGHTVWFNVDGGSTPPAAVGATSLLEVAISSTNRVEDVCNLARIALEGTGDYVIAAVANGFSITPTVPVGTTGDAADGTDGLLTYDTDVKDAGGGTLASGLVTDSDYANAHNDLKLPADDATGDYFVYLTPTSSDGMFRYGSFEGRVSVLPWNKPGVIFNTTADNLPERTTNF